MKYEHKVINGIGFYKPKYQEEELNKLGESGWELVSVSSQTILGITITYTHTFKRIKI